jgi:hypothetical protein
VEEEKAAAAAAAAAARIGYHRSCHICGKKLLKRGIENDDLRG